MLNFMKSRVVGPVEHPTGHEISRYVYHFEDAVQQACIERTRWENHGTISREAEEKRWGTISHGCPFPTFNITHRISERNETNPVEKTSVSFAEESEEFSSMTFRGKGLLSKARKGVATGLKETRISLPSRFSHFASSLHSNEILRRDPPSPPCFQGEQTRSLICSYFLTFASVYVRSSGFYDDFDISNVDQFTKGRILNFDEFRTFED